MLSCDSEFDAYAIVSYLKVTEELIKLIKEFMNIIKQHKKDRTAWLF